MQLGKLVFRILMKMADISFVEIDKFCDYLPFVSSITNLAALFVKAASSLVEHYRGADLTLDHHYFSHIQKEKKTWHCAILLIPFFGNLYVAMYPEGLSLIKMDRVSDYLPFVSTVVNIVDLFLKTLCSLVENYNGKDFTVDHHYFSYLHNEKKALRCAILLIPILGNLYIFIHPEKKMKEVVVFPKELEQTIPVAPVVETGPDIGLEAQQRDLVKLAKILSVLFLATRCGTLENVATKLSVLLEKKALFDKQLKKFSDDGGIASKELSGFLDDIDRYKSELELAVWFSTKDEESLSMLLKNQPYFADVLRGFLDKKEEMPDTFTLFLCRLKDDLFSKQK